MSSETEGIIQTPGLTPAIREPIEHYLFKPCYSTCLTQWLTQTATACQGEKTTGFATVNGPHIPQPSLPRLSDHYRRRILRH